MAELSRFFPGLGGGAPSAAAAPADQVRAIGYFHSRRDTDLAGIAWEHCSAGPASCPAKALL